MTRKEIVAALRHLKVETGSLACMGCGREHNCGTSGCRIMREAVDVLENDENQAMAMQRELERLRAQLGCATACAGRLRAQNQELRDAAALVTKLAGDAAVEREWIPVTERLPKDEKPVLAFVGYADPLIGFMTVSTYFAFDPEPHWQWDGLIKDREQKTLFWMPLPEAPEVD